MRFDPPYPVTGAVMAGGRSSRLGRDKALLEIEGETLLARTVRLLSSLCDEVIVVGPPERSSVVPQVRVVPDERPGIGPLGGIATALRAARHDAVLVVATDLPLLNPVLLQHLLRNQIHGLPPTDVFIPRVEGRTQQLHAIYSRRCLAIIDEQIVRGDFKIDRFFSRVSTQVIGEAEIRHYDPELHSFRNINTEDDWQAVQAILAAP
jgi:molybdopterin-guanine dinucleotide biosynthesis protein A